eukprot:2672341-Rhodomonas_salina.1
MSRLTREDVCQLARCNGGEVLLVGFVSGTHGERGDGCVDFHPRRDDGCVCLKPRGESNGDGRGCGRLNFHPRIVISEDDFEFFTQNKQLCDENEEIDAPNFKTLMVMQLEEYTQRKMAHVGETTQDSADHLSLIHI